MIYPRSIPLANIPSPINEIEFEGKKFLIKRDDLTGAELSGNKVRKLEFILHQAKLEKADFIFTCGGDQSNHARAAAAAASSLGIKSRLYLWGRDSKEADGNLFIDKLIGAEFRFLSKKEYAEVNELMFEDRLKLKSKGKRVYIIPEGGSSTLGIWGYIKFIEELSRQVDLTKLDGILTAAGSGGTSAGLLIGAAILKANLKIYAVNVLYPETEIKKKILNLAQGCKLDYKLDCSINDKNLKILSGYSEEGYKKILPEKMQLIKKLARETGIILDPVYTGKAFYAYYHNFLEKNLGKKILFVHTGGLFGVFGRRREYLSAI